MPPIPRNFRLDAAESAFFLRELENIESQTYQVDYPELKAERLIPTISNFDPGAAKLTFRTFDRVGKAEIVSDKSKRPPRVDVFGKEESAPVRIIADSFGYDVIEIKAAATAARNRGAAIALDQMRANAAREVVLRLEEDIAALGDSAAGLNGLLKHPDVPSDTAPNGATGGSPHWSTKTALEMLADLNQGVQKIRDNTLGIEAPDTLLLPEAQYTVAAQTPIGTDVNKTVLQFFLSNNPFIKSAESWHYLSAAGAGSSARAMFYRRDPNKVKLKNPSAYEQLPPQQEGIEWLIYCLMTTAGVTFYKPKSAYYLDGLA